MLGSGPFGLLQQRADCSAISIRNIKIWFRVFRLSVGTGSMNSDFRAPVRAASIRPWHRRPLLIRRSPVMRPRGAAPGTGNARRRRQG